MQIINREILIVAPYAAIQLNALAKDRVEKTAPHPAPNAPVVDPVLEPEARPNTTILPVSRTGGIVDRQNLVLARARRSHNEDLW
jgi:hypothetical protein